MSAVDIEFVSLPSFLPSGRRLTVQTPFLGRGVLTVGEAAIQVVWGSSRYPRIGRGAFVTTMDVGLDHDGRWKVGTVSITHGDGRPLETTKVGLASRQIGDWARSEAVAALTEGFLVYPNAIVSALMSGDEAPGEEAIAAGVVLIAERIDSDARARDLAAAVDARRKPDQLPVRARLDDLTASMRESHAPSF